MSIIDTAIIFFINQFSCQCYVCDKIIKAVAVNNLLKGGVFAAIIWWAWFRYDMFDSRKREQIISTLFGSIVSIAAARLMALLLPFRLRPIHDPSLNFVIPFGQSETSLEGWSSFPSDHAALFFALAAGLLFVSKKVGIFSLFYTALVICFPRIYVGLHWPSDILAGMLIGVIAAVLCNRYLIKIKYVHTFANLSYSQPMLFYPLLFLFTYQTADLFDSSRALVSAVFKLFNLGF